MQGPESAPAARSKRAGDPVVKWLTFAIVGLVVADVLGPF